MINQNPEQKARDNIDKMLVDAGWVVQNKKAININVRSGVVRYFKNEIEK